MSDEDRDRSRRKKKKSSSRSRSRRKHSRSRSPKNSKYRSRSRTPDPEEEARVRAEADEREKCREEYTVFVSQVHPKVDERDFFEFFSHVGRVEDIRLVRDARTQRSKGLCYVEFWEKDSVLKAVALTGQLLGGHPINVAICQPVQTNTTHQALKPMKLYVGNIHNNVTESDLRPVFEAFGQIESVQLLNGGYGFVIYKNNMDGKAALAALNGLEIAGTAISVREVEHNDGSGDSRYGDSGAGELDNNDGLAMTSEARAQLMRKLQRGSTVIPPSNPQNPVIASVNPVSVPLMQATCCLVVKNMFDPNAETDPEFVMDIEEDVRDECEKNKCVIKHIYVDAKSAGYVYLKFSSVSEAEKIKNTFHGRWFASRQIISNFISETTYNIKFKLS